MSGIAKFALAAAWLNLVCMGAWAQEPSSGQWLKDGGCALFSAKAHPEDTVHWTGACTGGYAAGLGTATFLHNGRSESFTANFVRGAVPDGHVITRWGQGWSYDGETAGGRFHGVGILTTDTGDHFVGRWDAGKMNGFGVLLRANGERYAGDWKDDKPNGKGELRRPDGSLLTGTFIDGKLAAAETVAPAGRAPERLGEIKTPARAAAASYRVGDFQGESLKQVTVKPSVVHPIDGPADAAIPSAALTGRALADPSNASQCLTVDSDGRHWGFRNACDFAVQFAYCLSGGGNSITDCGSSNAVTASATGSVAAKGFGALMADTSLADRDASHKFRWIACGGGSGEVVAHLDRFEPPAGRCERTRTASVH
ncbi:MAG TPA: hypothetical protein VJ750_05455 [Rhizomicrobium sp.]|nr:hypothetical protein [Rhizomicrobium sp.]